MWIITFPFKERGHRLQNSDLCVKNYYHHHHHWRQTHAAFGSKCYDDLFYLLITKSQVILQVLCSSWGKQRSRSWNNGFKVSEMATERQSQWPQAHSSVLTLNSKIDIPLRKCRNGAWHYVRPKAKMPAWSWRECGEGRRSGEFLFF